jgi:hypothetical protein
LSPLIICLTTHRELPLFDGAHADPGYIERPPAAASRKDATCGSAGYDSEKMVKDWLNGLAAGFYILAYIHSSHDTSARIFMEIM